ncbi:carbon-nitrogen hydrolase family protein [Salisediminibacterium beveridgei]|uniref:Putative carbon-nitrogen hydrolase n=1 Tax=Salisediminibacterium beveridgei TaxID=632773 RepID=A0A1D7QXN7_9BACI|nr:carbon-nitrogen hydrolase family protein [Salisediminibacterium beveridgei]AOM83770.1 putative carbon-nitrogen hydrolase [Salisediminibacterium beveridgei]
MIRVAAYQCEIPLILTKEDQLNHVQRLIDTIRGRFGRDQADLIVLPELSTLSYNRETFNRLPMLAEEANGKIFQQFSTLAKELAVTIAYGTAIVEDGVFTIAQVIVGTTGERIGVYHKMHVAQFESSYEKEYFGKGRKPFVFQVNDIRVGVMICYDMRFPQFAEHYALNEDVDLILHPVAFFRDETFPSWHHFVITRALENQVYWMSVNQAGPFFGQSIFSYPWLDRDNKAVISGDEEEITCFDVDRDVIAHYRTYYPIRDDNQFLKIW